MTYRNNAGAVSATPGNHKFKIGRPNFNRIMKKANAQPVELTSVVDATEFDQALEKDAAAISPSFKAGMFNSLGALAGSAIAGAIAYGVNKWKDKANMRKYYAALQQAVMMSPALKRYPIAELEGYMPMIIQASPTVAADPRLLANYLESMLDAEGHLNLGTFRELSALEGQVLSNRAAANPFNTEFAKGLSKGIGNSISTQFGNLGGRAMTYAFDAANEPNGQNTNTGNVG